MSTSTVKTIAQGFFTLLAAIIAAYGVIKAAQIEADTRSFRITQTAFAQTALPILAQAPTAQYPDQGAPAISATTGVIEPDSPPASQASATLPFTPEPSWTPTATRIPPSATPDLRLFWDDFDQGLKPEWELLQGYCTMSNGMLVCPDGDSRIEVGDYSWSNYRLAFDTGSYWIPGGAAALVGINANGSYLKLNFPVCHNAYWIYHGPDGSEQQVSVANGGVCEDGPFHVEIEAKDGIYSMKINSNAVGVFQENRIISGRIGFLVNGPWFDNVVITPLEP
ncbi:MAG TPA: hypothetical protein PKM01_07850 [Anaerolineaceae bacterium]|nr:hypothetical protein [Anaerolineaceae bacterium]